MDRGKWETTLTCFQASARGYIVRKEVRRAREDFEDVVREIDGGLTHLEWRETVIPIPHFTDTNGLFPRPSSTAEGVDICASPQIPSATGVSSVERRDHPALNDKGDREKESTMVYKDGGVMESTGDSTPVWSSLELDMNYGHSNKGSRQYCLAQEVPCTPEVLRLHRNTLTMELLWLQQAIDSRKKYLSLKDRLSVS
ncbi:IQ domain-containing protein C isoform X2 [Sparus aurata]|uniref:IQ domain-containing protein C isoform X2 n=1 Tax=Sparus aurata TaxID=8175 RepID=UPI0011C1B23D|nr:IQ domain-containing protein C isoform X2 [Sparus aurata]